MERAVLNELLREVTSLGVEINQHGLLEWDASLSYRHLAMVMGSDDRLYVSVYHSTGVDPVYNTGNTAWELFQPVGPQGAAGPATLAALVTNGSVGTGADQVARGDHTH